MGQIVQIEVRPDTLIEMLSMAVLHCRREMNGLADDAAAVLNDADEYHRILSTMDIALDVIRALGDFSSEKLVKIGGSEEWCEDGITIIYRRTTMTDDKHVDRYVRITNRERFLIVRALSLLADTCDTLGVAYEHGRMIALAQVFCEENWRAEYPIRYANKVKAVEAGR